ncbi:MAG TPA: phosphatase PAP2 family protein [Longimicrobiales bacterium]|nr:phosphatase PAP2 family protein [Longimicrobiales bacterium]
MQGEPADGLADALRPLGRRPPLFLAAGAAYALGTIAGERRVADLGLHTLLSVVVSNAVTGSLKMLGGRARPWIPVVQAGDTTWLGSDPYEWEAFAGLSEGGPRQSWPSGHTTTAFALATVLAEELGGPTPWIAYPVATGVAWSRVHDQAHWASDVVMGALVGIFSARLVVRYGHREGSWLGDVLLLDADPVRREVRFSVPWSW